MEFSGHVASVVEVTDGSELTADHLAGDTVLSIAEAADFYEGVDVLIADEVYEVTDVDSGDVSGEPTITVSPALTTDVDETTRVDVWDADTNTVTSEWIVTITDDTDGSAMEAPLSHALIPLLSDNVRGIVGESVVARQDDAGEWWVVEVIGARPGIDPAYFRTGTIQADVQITVGDPEGKRAVINGSSGYELYNAANEQTGNLDGEDNYLLGTFATDADDQPRVEIGAGVLGTLPAEQVRFPTENADEIDPAVITVLVADAGGEDSGRLIVSAPDWEGGHTRPQIALSTGTATNGLESQASLQAETVSLSADTTLSIQATDVVIDGTVDATMGDGSVGTGTFRDSVDARVLAVGGGGGSSRKTFAFFMGA